MFNNALKAELYKQFSKKSSVISPMLLTIYVSALSYFLIDLYLIQTNQKDNTIYADANIMFYLLLILAFFTYIIVSIIIPILIPTNVFSQDFNNNVIANTIALGQSRKVIFWSKILVTFLQCILYLGLSLLAFITLIYFFGKDSTNIAKSDSNIYQSIGNAIDYITSSITLTIYISSIVITKAMITISIAIFSVCMTKKTVPAFFTSFGLYIIASIISIAFIVIASSYITTLGESNWYLMLILINLFVSCFFIMLSYSIFTSIEY